MKAVHSAFSAGFIIAAGLFFLCGVFLVFLAALEMWHAVNPWNQAAMGTRFNLILESIGLLTMSVASLELGQTVMEEEVLRSARIDTSTRMRRFLSRFLIVVVVSLSIECLVAVFQLLHEKPELLPHAASIGIAAALLLAAWAAFARLFPDLPA